MTTAPALFSVPSEIEDREPGDFLRTQDGRPYVFLPCGCGTGRIPGLRPGTTKRCPVCTGDGWRKILCTRITTYIDCLGDKTMIEKWKQRVILAGIRADQGPLLARLEATHPLERDNMQAIADEAFELGEGYLKANYGTELHKLTECWDKMQPLPEHTPEQAADFRAWLELVETHRLTPVDIERRCYIADLKVAGTPDRTYYWRNRLVLADLKTGNVDIDPGKIAMQLAIASRGQWYDPDTRELAPMDVSQAVGLLIHLPKGEATARLYELDLHEGWRGVQLARTVREWRTTSRKVLTEVSAQDWPYEIPA